MRYESRNVLGMQMIFLYRATLRKTALEKPAIGMYCICMYFISILLIYLFWRMPEDTFFVQCVCVRGALAKDIKIKIKKDPLRCLPI